MIASHILIQAGAGPAAIVTAAPGAVPGATEKASLAGPCDVIARAGPRDAGERARLGASRARVCGTVRMAAQARRLARAGRPHPACRRP
jgi:hypothetical protein